MFSPLLDRLLYRHPFEGGSARRYARAERVFARAGTLRARAEQLPLATASIDVAVYLSRTAPPAHVIAELATAAGFAQRSLRADPVQPVYIQEFA